MLLVVKLSSAHAEIRQDNANDDDEADDIDDGVHKICFQLLGFRYNYFL